MAGPTWELGAEVLFAAEAVGLTASDSGAPGIKPRDALRAIQENEGVRIVKLVIESIETSSITATKGGDRFSAFVATTCLGPTKEER